MEMYDNTEVMGVAENATGINLAQALKTTVVEALSESATLDLSVIARNITSRYTPMHRAVLQDGLLTEALIVHVAQSLGLVYLENGRAVQGEEGEDEHELARQFNAFVRELHPAVDSSDDEFPVDRDALGRVVWSAWADWARAGDRHALSQAIAYEQLPQPERELYRTLGDAVARFILANSAGLHMV